METPPGCAFFHLSVTHIASVGFSWNLV